jgi:hypothetical protein
MQFPNTSRPIRFALLASCAALLIAATPMVAQQMAGPAAPAEATAGVRMPVWPGSADHVALIVAAVQRAVSTTPTADQPAADAAAPVDAKPLPGPRVRPDIRGVEPRLAEDRTAAPPAAGNNTIVISTLALVLIAVIVTILVVK